MGLRPPVAAIAAALAVPVAAAPASSRAAATSEGRLAHQQLAYMLGTIVHSQQVQVGQMSTWLRTWYAA